MSSCDRVNGQVQLEPENHVGETWYRHGIENVALAQWLVRNFLIFQEINRTGQNKNQKQQWGSWKETWRIGIQMARQCSTEEAGGKNVNSRFPK